MKKIFTLFGLLILGLQLISQPVAKETAKIAAENFLKQTATQYFISDFKVLTFENEPVAYIASLQPQGFLILSNHLKINPIIAYSFTNALQDENMKSPMTEMVSYDLFLRLQYIQSNETYLNALSEAQWNSLFETKNGNSFYQDMKPLSNGFLETNWTQSAPYNAFCPLDIYSGGGRSVVGCPATAMAQILNYNEEINATQFDDTDDYYHNYYNQYTIDDDYATFDFPSFPELNIFLDSLDIHYSNGIAPTQDEIAALNFACGVAARQVYSSSVSGTFGVDQAYDAYQKFGFQASELLMGGDTSINQRIIHNMMYSLPVHLALVNPEVTVGHNVVIDGYNVQNFFHLNFGWGGSSNGWYTMPPTSIPYNLTVIEGVVVDINYDSTMPPPPAVEADFEASQTNIPAGNSINFTDLSINNPEAWNWYFEGGSPETSTIKNPQNIVYTQAGLFKVSLKAYNPFSADSVCKEAYIQIDPVSVSKNSSDNANVRLFQNKDNIVQIKLINNEQIVRMKIYDITGQLIMLNEINQMDNRFDLSGFAGGLYIIKLNTDSWVYSKKIIVEN